MELQLALKNECDFELKTPQAKGPAGPRPRGRCTWSRSVGLRLDSERMRLEMPPRGQMAEEGSMYFASDLLKAPQFCVSVSLGSPWSFRHPAATAGQCLSGRSTFGEGVSRCRIPGFSPPPGVGQLAQDTAARTRAFLWLGTVDLKLSPTRMEGVLGPLRQYGLSKCPAPRVHFRAESLG